MAITRTLLHNVLLMSNQSSRLIAIGQIPLRRYQHQGQRQEDGLAESKPNRDIIVNTWKDFDPLLEVGQIDEAKVKTFIDNIRPPLKRSFNLAAHVNSSRTLQIFVTLGVSLYDIENTNYSAATSLVGLDFERDCIAHILFLRNNGLRKHNLGRFISEFPNIFQVPLSDLEVRVNYLKSKGFTNDDIAKALNRSSHIISNNIKTLDYKLGEFQVEFGLPAEMLRKIVVKYPPVVALPGGQYKLVHFTLAEEYGFKLKEIHTMLQEQPEVLDLLRPVLIDRLELLHNTFGLSHETICRFPKLIVGPFLDIRHRASYLKKLKRDQYDPRRPLYVQPSALYNGTDEEFCRKFAKTSIKDYKLFLKNS